MARKVNPLLLVSGILAACIDIAIIAVFDTVTPNYHWIRQYVSEYGIIPGMASKIVPTWWICYGLLLLLFSIGLNRSIERSGRADWLGPLLIALYGLLDSVGSSIFPMDPGGVMATFSGIIHFLLSFLGVVAIILSPLALIPRLRCDRAGSRLLSFSKTIQILFGVQFVLCILAVFNLFMGEYVGLLQRIFILTANLWIAILSFYGFIKTGVAVSAGPLKKPSQIR